MRREETEPHVSVIPPGSPHLARAAGQVFYPVPGLVPDHGAGEPVQHPAYQAEPSPPHPHVLLPKPFGPHRCLLFIMLMNMQTKKSIHLLPRLHHTGVFLYTFQLS